MKRSHLFIGAVIASVAFIFFSFFFARGEERLTVAFFDVGQGDAIFIESPAGAQLLVDGGPDAAVVRRLSSVMPLWDRSLDLLLISNPDEDHVRGFLDVLARFEVAAVMEPGTVKETTVYKELERAIVEEGAERLIARRGMVVDMGGGVSLEILFPDRDAKGLDANTGSIVARLVYRDTEVFLPGDAPEAVEKYLVELDGEQLRSDLLKAGHHGSRTSSGEALLSAVAPSVAVISAGKNSRYGHPHQEVLDRLADFGVETHVTAQEGTVIYVSDGVQLKRLK